MTFTLAHYSTNDWAILLLVLILGILLGMLARGGDGRYRRAAEEERAARIELERAYEARLRDAHARIAELERETPVVHARGADALSAIDGIDAAREARLNELGVHRYRDITGLSDDGERALEEQMLLEPGTIEREAWREQAARLDRDPTA